MFVLLSLLFLVVLPCFAGTHRRLLQFTLVPGLLLGSLFGLAVWELNRHGDFGTAIAFLLLLGAIAFLLTLAVSRLVGLWWQARGATRLMALGVDVLGLSLATTLIAAPGYYQTHVRNRPPPAECTHIPVDIGGNAVHAPLSKSISIYPADPKDALYLFSPSHQRRACRASRNGEDALPATALTIRTGEHDLCHSNPSLAFAKHGCAPDEWRRGKMTLFDPMTADRRFFFFNRSHADDVWRDAGARCRANSGPHLACSAILSISDNTHVFWEFSAKPGSEAKAYASSRKTALKTVDQLWREAAF